MGKVRVILVGGFLGAGKTTLLSEVANRLVKEGKRVGIITNDQAPNLVDTGLLSTAEVGVNEVAGGCFCCKFEELESSATELIDRLKPDYVLGEPVGSCTDISATVLQPIKWLWGGWASLAPFSVLTDPRRLREALDEGTEGSFPANVLYIFRKQLEEADYIVINKTDLVTAGELGDLRRDVAAKYPQAKVLTMSAQSGEGVTEWLEALASGDAAVGQRVVEVDYETYAQGEAALGWLNATVAVTGPASTDWASFVEGLLGAVQAKLVERHAETAHLKAMLTTAGGSVVVNVTTSEDKPKLRGSITGPATEAALTINARVHVLPEDLTAIVTEALAAASVGGIESSIETLQSFQPGYPTPVHRFGKTVEDGGRPAGA
jgi:G3E family GTPase